MSVRRKLLLVLVTVLVVFAALQYMGEESVVAPSFASLERDKAADDLVRCTEALSREVLGLDTSAHDWSAWDDTYRFVRDRNPDYVAANLLLASLANLRIDVLCFFDVHGRLAWGATTRPGPDGEPSFGPPTWRSLAPDHPLLAIRDVRGSVGGALVTDHGLLLVASRPIVTGDEKGPVRGVVIMGRFLDRSLLRSLSSQTRVTFSVWPIGSATLDPPDADALG